MMIDWAPAAAAFWAPRRLGASATIRSFGWAARAARVTSAASAICGIAEGGTKLATSISETPAAAIAAIQRNLAAVGIIVLAICSPSRGPTSRTVIAAASGMLFIFFLGRFLPRPRCVCDSRRRSADSRDRRPHTADASIALAYFSDLGE